MDSLKEIARMIDHALLHPTLTDKDIVDGCELAKKYGVASVCVKPYSVKLAKSILKDSEVKVGTVIGFPHGSNSIETKLFEAKQAISDGAEELDMVINIGKLLSADFEYIQKEIQTIVEITKRNYLIVKVIFETDYLTDDFSKIKLCEICSTLKVDFVKTSTGFGYKKMADGSFNTEGATDCDLILMRTYCSPEVQIKASGGIRRLEDVLRVKKLGVTRVGTSATEAILNEGKRGGALSEGY
jgi:deoxyribose-phosphate aldolase